MIKRTLFFCCVIVFMHGLSFAEECPHLPNIKTVTVQDDAITVEFDFDLTYSDGVVQVMDIVDANGKRRDIAFGSIQVVGQSEVLRWGDGDHVFHSLELIEIKNGEATVEVVFEHRPPATHEHLAVHESDRCQISSVVEKSH